MNIFVGNISFASTQGDVKKLFAGFGSVASVKIVMDKKGRHSRGFGFVEMPDEQQAKEAIAALDSKEFMGRPLNVEAARTTSEAGPEAKKSKEIRAQINPGFQRHPREDGDHSSAQVKPAFARGSRYKQGRRAQSFMQRRAAAGIKEPVSERKIHENPLRWRKKPKPWRKTKGALKPWEKPQGPSGWRGKSGGFKTKQKEKK